MIWRCGRFGIDLTERPLFMGILNATPDSFSDGYPHKEAALDRARQLIADGADIVDVGGESTRPGSDPISLEAELDRVIPIVEVIAREYDIPISVDTQKAGVAEQAIAAGAHIINHVSGSLDFAAIEPVLRNVDAGYVAMHMKNRPKIMQKKVVYRDVVTEVTRDLTAVRDHLIGAGISRDRLLFDPGIGFGKKLEHNLSLLKNLKGLAEALQSPLLMGVSRKSWLSNFFGVDLPDLSERDAYSVVASLQMPFPDVAIHRVHNVRLFKNAFTLAACL